MKKLSNLIRRYINFIFIDEKTKHEQYESADDVLKTQNIYSSLSFQFLAMLSAASLISSLGLMSDSGVIIVGAMLIAPLMKPIMSLSYSMAYADSALKLRSCNTLILGVVLTLFISYMSEFFIDLNSITNQMATRIEPNLFDLGVAIAAGIASAIAMTRRSVADSLPGVAIAVAIVPPLCVSGMSLSMGEFHAFYGAFLLFGVNLFAIIISAIFVFSVSGYGSIKNSLIYIPILLIILTIMAFPLKQSLILIEDKDKVQSVVETWLHNNYPHNIDIHPSDLNEISVIEKPDHIFVYIEFKSPINGITEAQISYIHTKIQKLFNVPINLKIQLLLTQEVLKYNYKTKGGNVPIYGKDTLIPRK